MIIMMMALRPCGNLMITMQRLSSTLSTKVHIHTNQNPVHGVTSDRRISCCYLPPKIQTTAPILKPLLPINETLTFSRTLSTSLVCHKTFGKKKKGASTAEDEDSDDDDEEEYSEDELTTDSEDDMDDSDLSDEEDSDSDDGMPKDYKDIRHDLKSLRIDAVLSKGLNISRKKVEDSFLSTKLRVNGKVVTKKGKKVKAGDMLDFIKGPAVPYQGDDKTQKGEDMVSVMRVVVKKVLPDKTAKDKVRVVLRRWKNLKLPKSKVL